MCHAEMNSPTNQLETDAPFAGYVCSNCDQAISGGSYVRQPYDEYDCCATCWRVTSPSDMVQVQYVYNHDGSVPVVTSNRGDIYEGPLIDGKAEGQGKFTYADGSGYTGSFRAGKREGSGRQVWADGDMYEGGFKADLIAGIGKYSWSDGRCAL